MKKINKLIIVAVCAILAVGVLALTACTETTGEHPIAVVSRDAVSGSRQAFDYSVTNSSGRNLTNWQTTPGNLIPGDQFNSQSGVVSAVAANRNAIGYASLSAVENNATVKMLHVNGAAPGASGYPAAFVRDFVIMVPEAGTQALLPRTQVFYDFLQSSQASEAIADFGLDSGLEDATPFVAPADPGQTPRIQIRGSTTVTPLMEHLISVFNTIVPWANDSIFDFNAGGSGQGRSVGRNQAIEGAQAYTTGAAIGMSSAGADNVPANGKTFRLAYDTTVVIVHPENPIMRSVPAAAPATGTVSRGDITVSELFLIYTGVLRDWSALMPAVTATA